MTAKLAWPETSRRGAVWPLVLPWVRVVRVALVALVARVVRVSLVAAIRPA